MNKNEFIALVADRAATTKANAATILDAFQDVVLEEIIAKEDSVRMKFGTILGYTKETSARTGRNPQTGETIDIPAKTLHGFPKIKWSKSAKE